VSAIDGVVEGPASSWSALRIVAGARPAASRSETHSWTSKGPMAPIGISAKVGRTRLRRKDVPLAAREHRIRTQRKSGAPVRVSARMGRNEQCRCGSDLEYKLCNGRPAAGHIAGHGRCRSDLLAAYIRSALLSLSKWRVVNNRASSR
jgi:hypothetical protein